MLGSLLLLLCARQPLQAQSQPVTGTVVDPAGAVVPGATVTITDLNKGQVVKTTTTDASGRFSELNIQPGRYSVSIEVAGFKKSTVSFDVDVDRQVTLGNIALTVGNVTETVSVNEVAPPVETSSMDKAYLVDQQQISQLPMNGRNWIALMNTVPGMSSSAQSDFNVNFNDVSQFHGLGGRGSQNNFYLDGSPNVDVGDNQSQYTQPSIDALGEFRVLQSAFNAEYGRAEGVAIAVQTKAGAAQFHGTAYEYLRNDFFDAKCVLCNTLHPTLRYNQFGGNLGGWLYIPKISTPQNKKLFFFYNREMTRRNLPGSAFADVPNAQVLNGNFSAFIVPGSKLPYAPQPVGTVFQPGTITRDNNGNITGGTPYPGNVVPQSQWNPQSSALLNVYTKLIPGYTSLAAAPSAGYSRYFYNNPDVLQKDQDLARVDYQVNEKFSTFFRWVNDYQKEQFQTGVWAGEPFPIQPQVRPKPGSSWSWNLVNTFTPTLAAETVLSYNHQSQSLSIVGSNPVSISAIGATFPQLYPQTNITNSIPNVTTNSGVGFSLGNPGWHNWGKDYSITENVTKVWGQHTIKFGAYINWDKKAQTATWPQNASIDFSSSASMPLDTGNGLANLMLGNFNNYSEANAAIYPFFGFQEQDFYAQDSWKVSSRLTVNLGLRFARIVPTYTIVRGGTPGGEGTFKLYSVDLSKFNAASAPLINLQTGYLQGNVLQELTNEGLICDPCSGTNKGFAPTKNFLQPRVGLAYDVFGNGKTAVRAGFGMFNERLRQNNFNFGAGSNYPNQFSSTALYGNVSNFNVSAPTGQAPPSMTIFPTNDTMPSIYSWYFGVQHSISSSMTLDVSYSGNHSVHLMDQRQINALPAGYTTANPTALTSVNNQYTALVPYRGWGNLTAVETNAYSRYNALMMRLSRRFGKGLSGNVNYTYSKATDIVDNDSDQINNPFNIAAQYAPAGYNQTHVFSTDWVYNLPSVTKNRGLGFLLNGWELTAILSVHSGMPFTVYSGGNLDGYNAGTQYVNVSGNVYANQNSSQWINPAAFIQPADGSYGTTGRNAFHLPWVQNLDSSLLKNFQITERVKVVYRFEVFNIFNHPEIWGLSGVNGTGAGTGAGFTGLGPGLGINAANDATFGQVNSWRDPRNIQMALRFEF